LSLNFLCSCSGFDIRPNSCLYASKYQKNNSHLTAPACVEKVLSTWREICFHSLLIYLVMVFTCGVWTFFRFFVYDSRLSWCVFGQLLTYSTGIPCDTYCDLCGSSLSLSTCQDFVRCIISNFLLLLSFHFSVLYTCCFQQGFLQIFRCC